MRDDEEHGPGARRPARRRRVGRAADRDDEPPDARAGAPAVASGGAAMSDAELVAGLRRDEPRAFAEYVRRFHRLLAYFPWRAGFDADASRDLALEVLEDAMLDLIAPDAVVPRSLHGWLVTRLRRRLANDVRADRRRRVREAGATYDAGAAEASAALCSEATLRLCRGADAGDPEDAGDDAPAGVAQRLGAALAAGLDAEERQLLAWLAESVPQREIADALGTTHAALRKRVERLRVRLRVEATRALEAMSPADRRVAQRLLGRGAARDSQQHQEQEAQQAARGLAHVPPHALPGGLPSALPHAQTRMAAPADGATTWALTTTTANAPGSGR